MKLRLHDAFVTPNYHKRVHFELDLSENELLSERGIQAHPCDVTLEIRSGADIVTARFFGTVEYRTQCDRCLKPIDRAMQFDYTKDVQKEDISDEFDGIILQADETFDATEEVAGEVLVSFPMKHLCKDDCKGLCPVCGCDRNEQECSCVQKELDPRLEVLRNLSL